jgi:large subunit ribosomal protein L23
MRNMGLFGKKVTEAEEVQTVVKAKPQGIALPHDMNAVLIKPRITEKAALLLERNVYTFEVKKGTTKYDVMDAVKALYKVTPVSVRIVNKQPRHYMSRARGRNMMEQGLKKAYVYLKKGDHIDLV